MVTWTSCYGLHEFRANLWILMRRCCTGTGGWVTVAFDEPMGRSCPCTRLARDVTATDVSKLSNDQVTIVCLVAVVKSSALSIALLGVRFCVRKGCLS